MLDPKIDYWAIKRKACIVRALNVRFDSIYQLVNGSSCPEIEED